MACCVHARHKHYQGLLHRICLECDCTTGAPKPDEESRTCTWVRDTDGAPCTLTAGHTWPHLDAAGVEFPEQGRTIRGRVMRVA